MNQRTYIKDLQSKIGMEVIIKGFVDTLRDQNKIIFLLLRDDSGLVQNVVLKDCPDFDIAKNLSEESVVEISGLVKEEKQAPGGFEIETKTIKVISAANPELPIPIKVKKGGEETNPNTRFDYRWLDIRKPEKNKIFKVWTAAEKGIRDFYYKNNFVQLYTPSLMGMASETGSEVFEVKYFDRKAYLAQSPQFYKQMGIASGFDKVFMMGPVFRAEESFTSRHMTEFVGWDFEIGYVNSHFDVMANEEQMIISAITEVKKQMPEIDIEIPTAPFPKLAFSEAKAKLAKAGITSEKEFDLSPEEEREICKISKEETGSDFVFITNYHKSIRAFYHMRLEENPDLTKSADLLFRGIEITTLAQREHRLDILKKQAVEKKMNLAELDSYLKFFEFGCPAHGGGGIGANRFIMKIMNYDNVREVTYLPRDVNRLNP